MITSDNKNLSNGTFKFLAFVVVLVGLSIIIGLAYPQAFSLFVSILWVILLGVVVIFFALGILVMIGLKKDALRLLDVLFEGSLTIIDLVEFIRISIHKFVALLRDFLLFMAPFFALLLTFTIYVIIIVIYKLVGRTYDVTLLTIVLTVFFVVMIGLLNSSTRSVEIDTWKARFTKRFHNSFSDFLEVILFVFFLTMDSTNLFFLPENLNIEIKSQIGNYNLMTQSFIVDDHIKITLNIIIAGIFIEITRNVIRLLTLAVKEYRQRSFRSSEPKADIYKSAIRLSFNESKDDILKFITFTTILISGFLVFPRLKLLTIAVASFASLMLDLTMPSRLTTVKGDNVDLISRVIIKVFKL